MDNENQFEKPFDAAPASVETTAGKQSKEKEVKVRTMQSDLKSLQESGGQAPQPYTTEINQHGQSQNP